MMIKVPSDSPELTVGQVAARSGVAVSALHFYESEGLISSHRTEGNQRRFSRDVLRRVAFIKVSQRIGIPLKQIGEALASLPRRRTPTAPDWARLARRWEADLTARIQQLEQLRDDLGSCIGCGCLSMGKCKLRNRDDVMGARHGKASTLEFAPDVGDNLEVVPGSHHMPVPDHET